MKEALPRPRIMPTFHPGHRRPPGHPAPHRHKSGPWHNGTYADIGRGHRAVLPGRGATLVAAAGAPVRVTAMATAAVVLVVARLTGEDHRP